MLFLLQTSKNLRDLIYFCQVCLLLRECLAISSAETQCGSSNCLTQLNSTMIAYLTAQTKPKPRALFDCRGQVLWNYPVQNRKHLERRNKLSVRFVFGDGTYQFHALCHSSMRECYIHVITTPLFNYCCCVFAVNPLITVVVLKEFS